jgi:hypothetical protein
MNTKGIGLADGVLCVRVLPRLPGADPTAHVASESVRLDDKRYAKQYGNVAFRFIVFVEVGDADRLWHPDRT